MLDTLRQLACTDFANHTALQNEFNSYSYSELNILVSKCTAYIDEHSPIGVTNNLTVGLCFESQTLHLICSLALLKAGHTQVSIQASGPLTPKKRIASDCQLDFLICDFDINIGVKVLKLNLSSVQKQVAHHRCYDFDAKKTAMIIPGSGTTGVAKLIEIDFGNLNLLMQRDLLAREIQAGEKHFSLTPIEFYTSKRRNFAYLIKGACIFVRGKSRTSSFDLISKLRIEHLSIASSHAKQLVAKYRNAPTPAFPYLKSLFLGGSPISEKVRKAIKTHITENLYIAYGTNEVGEVCIATPEMQEQFPNCIGKPLPEIELQITNVQGVSSDRSAAESVNSNSGILAVKAKGSYSGYRNAGYNARPVFEDEWFYPNDLVASTDDDVLIYLGRSDDAIIFDGVIIYPREIEQHLENIEGIDSAAAFGVDTEETQRPAVAFTADRAMDMKQINAFLKEQMGWQQPHYVFQLTSMPRNKAGKILKREIKQAVMAKIQRQTNIV